MPRHLFSHRHANTRHAPVPPLPHPSWAQGEGAGARSDHQIDASEFWQRLGL